MTTYTATTINHARREQLLEVARSFGLNPDVMSGEDLTAEGYNEFLYTRDGAPALHPQTMSRVRVRRSWPAGAWERIEPLLDVQEESGA